MNTACENWIICAAFKSDSLYEEADLLWIAWGERKPYRTFKYVMKHFKVFNNER